MECERVALTADLIHIWRVDTNRLPSVQAWARLSEDEKHRADRLQSLARRWRWVWAHAALRDILENYVGNEQPLSFQKGPFGKPYLSSVPDLHFNLSHSGNFALIALAVGCKVGVDVEHVRHAPALKVTAERAFSAIERATLSRLTADEYVKAFYRCWTRKEALVKAWGLGLSADMATFDVTVESGKADVIDVRSPAPNTERWSLADLMIDDSYAAAIATEGMGRTYRLCDWTDN